jgi:hypothetical protein
VDRFGPTFALSLSLWLGLGNVQAGRHNSRLGKDAWFCKPGHFEIVDCACELQMARSEALRSLCQVQFVGMRQAHPTE